MRTEGETRLKRATTARGTRGTRASGTHGTRGATRGAAIGHISPEAASGGPIGLLRDGDMIEIDIPGGRLDVDVSAEELERRRAEQPEWTSEVKGYLGRYARMVTSADTGAVLR